MSKDLETKIEALIEKRNKETEALKNFLEAFDKKAKKKSPPKKKL